MDNVELATWLDNAAINYEFDLEDKMDRRTAADIFVDNVLSILTEAGRVHIKLNTIKLFDATGSGVTINGNEDIFGYTE